MPHKRGLSQTGVGSPQELIHQNLCFFCYLPNGKDNGICGRMEKSPKIWAHRKCMQYNSRLWQYDDDLGFGGFKIDLAVKAHRATAKYPCTTCMREQWKTNAKPTNKKGASAGCAIASCRKAFHFPCAPLHSKIQKKNSRGKNVDFFRVWCSETHKDQDMKQLELLNVDTLTESSESDSDSETEPAAKKKSKQNKGHSPTPNGNTKVKTNGDAGGKEVKVLQQSTRLIRSDGRGMVEVSDDIAKSLPANISTSLTSVSRLSSTVANGGGSSNGNSGRNDANPSRRASKSMGSILDTINSSILNSFVPIEQSCLSADQQNVSSVSNDQNDEIDGDDKEEQTNAENGRRRSHGLIYGDVDDDVDKGDDDSRKANVNGDDRETLNGGRDDDINENHLSDDSLHRGVRNVVEFGLSASESTDATRENQHPLVDDDHDDDDDDDESERKTVPFSDNPDINEIPPTPDATDPESAAPDARDPESAAPNEADPESAAPDEADPESAVPDEAELNEAAPNEANPDSATPFPADNDFMVSEAASPGSVEGYSTPLAVSPARASLNNTPNLSTDPNRLDTEQNRPSLDETRASGEESRLEPDVNHVVLDETAHSMNETNHPELIGIGAEEASTNGLETESCEDHAVSTAEITVEATDNNAEKFAAASEMPGEKPVTSRLSSDEDREQSRGIRAAVTRVLEALHFISRPDPSTEDSSSAERSKPSSPSGLNSNGVTDSASSSSPSSSSRTDATLICMSTSGRTRLKEQWHQDSSEFLSNIGRSDESPKLLIWPDCVYKTAQTSLPKELVLYHVIETMRALSACGEGGTEERRGNSKDDPLKLSDEFKSRLRSMLLIADVQEDDVEGYKSLRKMDISLSNGDPGNVARIIMEGYRDTLAEETEKISQKMSNFKMFHKDVGERREGGGGAGDLTASSVESAVFFLLDKTSDPGEELRRQLTTVRTRSWRMGDESSRKKPLADHSTWPPEDVRAREEAESIFHYVQETAKEKVRFSVLPKDSLFVDEKGNPSLQLLRKKLLKKHSNSRPSPGKHEVTLLHLAPSHLVPAYSSFVRKAFFNFVCENFEIARVEASSSSSSTRPGFFIAASHSRGKVCFHPFNFLADNALSSLLADRKLTCDVVTMATPNGDGDHNSIFVFTLRAFVAAQGV